MSFDKEKIAELYPEAENLMIEPMLIWKLPSDKQDMKSEVCTNGEYFAQEKIDGGFYQFVKTDNFSYLFGRTVSKTSGILTEKSANVPHIKSALNILPPNTILIGEIYVPGGTSKNVTHIMGCLPEEAIKRQAKEGLIHYYIHDIISYDGIDLKCEGALGRYKILEAIWKKHELYKYDFLRLATLVEDNIEEELSHILSSGGEGMVLKKKNALYAPGKRPAWTAIKFKQMDSIDLVITRLIDATQEYTGKELQTWPYWEIGTPTFYDCFEEDHCFAGWKWEKAEGNYYSKYLEYKFIHGGNDFRRYVQDDEKNYRPVTKPYFLGWKTAIGIGAYNQDGELIELGTVSSGLTDEMRVLMTTFPDNYIGHVCSLDCMSIDKKEHTLRHPVFKSMREDKDADDCKIEEIFG